MADPPQLLGNFWLGKKLGSGYSGSIFRAMHVHTGKVVALKVQRVDHECPTNRYERAFYPCMQGGEGIPTLWAAGVAGPWDYLAIDLLGLSLDTLYRRSRQETMDLRSVCCIAMQLISRLEFMHSRGILHRDIQLGNCVVGLPPRDTTIYMIDFGFSKSYIDITTKRHIPDSNAKRLFVGNYWFSSVGVHCKGKVPSRRDDLESVALMLIHLLTPRGLSWTRNGVPRTDEHHDRLVLAKRRALPEILCKGLPSEFEEFLRYCRRLRFEERPNYTRWREEFRQLAVEEGFPASEAFIWPPPPLRNDPPTPRVMAITRRAPVGNAERMENILQDLANLNLGGRKIHGDHTNAGKDDGKGGVPPNANRLADVVEISDGSEGSTPAPPTVVPKADRLIQLAKAVPAAADNLTLSNIITDFITALQSNTSRSLTREGFAFLDALYKQLADPSVYILPHRTTRTRSSDKEQVPDPGSQRVKLDAVARLKMEVRTATRNQALAKMVADFTAVMSKGRKTITKDGIGFLSGLAERLVELR